VAKYIIHENGDSTKTELPFETKKGFYVSGKTLSFEFAQSNFGLNEVTD